MLTVLNFVGFITGLIALVAFVFLIIAGFKRSVLWGIVVLLIPFGTLVYGIKYWAEVKKPFLGYVCANAISYAIFFYVFNQFGGMEMINMSQKIHDGTMTEQDAALFMQNTMDNLENMGGESKEDMIAQMRADPNVTEEDIKTMEALFGEIEAVASGESKSFEKGMERKMREIKREASSNNQIDKEYSAPSLESTASASRPDNSENIETQTRNEVADPRFMHDDPITPPTALTTEPAPMVVDQKLPDKVKKTGLISLAEAKNYIGRSVAVTTSSGVVHKARILGVEKNTLMLEKRTFGGVLTFNISSEKIESIKLESIKLD